MSTRVNIEAEAWGDIRFATLARLCKLVDSDHALVKCARIWAWQTEHFTPESPTYVVDIDIVESVLGEGAAEILIRCRLAEPAPGGVRIKGSEGRIEWLYRNRSNGKKRRGGHERVAGARAGAPAPGDQVPNGSAAHKQVAPAPAPAPAPGDPGVIPGVDPLTLTLTPEECSLSRAHAIPDTAVRTPVPREPDLRSPSGDPDADARARALQNFQNLVDERAPLANATLAHPRPVSVDPRVKLNHDAWTYARETHARLRAAGIDPHAVLWSAMPSGAAAGDLVERTREILADNSDVQRALAIHRRRIDVAAAEAQQPNVQHLKWFTPSRIYARESFWKAAEMDPAQVRRPSRSQAAEHAPLRVGSLGDDS